MIKGNFTPIKPPRPPKSTPNTDYQLCVQTLIDIITLSNNDMAKIEACKVLLSIV